MPYDARRFINGLFHISHLHVGMLFLRVDKEQPKAKHDKLCSEEAFQVSEDGSVTRVRSHTRL